ncbi:MAG: hypothetical protein H6745_33815 [Deltaproteobacteria bacterium]|nr:hypothetical protein [Deltaproteobacteria bacterium]
MRHIASSLTLALAVSLALSAAGCSGEDPQSGDVGGGDVVDVVIPGEDTAIVDVGADTTSADTAPEDTTPTEGGFGWPCETNGDCLSGWCIRTDDGDVCTRACETSCPGDWRCVGVATSGVDVSFLCFPPENRLCDSCAVDADCADGYCVLDPSGHPACTRPCTDGAQCPEGFACTETTSLLTGQSSLQCATAADRCACDPAARGGDAPCAVADESAGCWVVQVCDDAGACVPATAEECAAGAACELAPAAAGAACADDGLVCTVDTCDGAGSCVHAPATPAPPAARPPATATSPRSATASAPPAPPPPSPAPAPAARPPA